MKKIALIAFLLYVTGMPLFAQEKTNAAVLAATAKVAREQEVKELERAVTLAHQKGWPLSYKTTGGNISVLVGVDPFGYPLYYSTESNIVAAATTGASLLWPGGSSGLGLNGSGANLKDKMAIWDGGSVLASHVELVGRVVQRDAPASVSDHSTHVAGTMIASGVNPNAKGMAFAFPELVAYDFNNDVSEMSGEASGLLLSNHSYGSISGWRYNESAARWEFWGRAGDNEDYKFGYYDNSSQMYDSIAYNAPFYLIVKSSGNNRSENGPAVGSTYWRFNASGTMVNAGPRPAGISNNDGYDIIPTYGTAKNILTIGAVAGIPFGYTRKEDVVMSSFSSWGPTDDGRIKPDLVADGVDVLSSIGTSNTSYASFSGTSMATPNTTGSLLLLQQYYAQLHSGAFMRSATLKALAIHTANEAGSTPGPDYSYGWGLLNVAKSADVIKANNTGNHMIQENTLNNGGTFTTTVVASGRGPLVATIVWTDPKADVETSNILNNSARKLVNDLDIRITKGAAVYRPWILDPANPAAAATTGDNVLDNVERINIDDAVPGQTYTITVTHKGTLQRGSQAYSLVMSGIGGQAYCASAPTSNAGARIDKVTFGSINQTNTSGCTTYTDYTRASTSVEPGQTIPITVNVSSCDATVALKLFKVFIDFNNNGSFTDAGELVASETVPIASGSFTKNITIPTTVAAGNSAIMRVIVQETSNPADITPCGSYGRGETQDFRILFSAPSNDVSPIELMSPTTATCSNTAQLVTIRLRNNGSVAKSNIPLSVTVKQGSTTVATLTATFPGTIAASSVSSYTFQTPVATTAGATYSFEIIASDAADQDRSNDTLRTSVTIAAAPSAPTAAGEICGSVALLRVSNPNNSANYFWYTSATSEAPIANGSTVSTGVIPTNNTYYVGSGAKGTVGLPNNTVYGAGGGYLSGSANYMKYSASVPVILETAKLYSKSGGKIDLIVADITNVTSTGYSYSAISSTTIDIYPTSPTPATGTQAVFDPADNGADFYMNLLLPAGDHVIIVKPQGDANLFRNNNVTGSPYPFSLGTLISFTGNSATSATDPNFFQSFYYYLYNMKVRTLDCVSNRTTVVASVAPTPTISQVNDELVSSIDNGNQWYLNGVAISGATNKRYRPVESGNYTVMVSDNFGCQRVSSAFAFVINAINPVDNAAIGLAVSPNPNKGTFALKFKAATREDMRIEIINAQGQPVHVKNYPKFSGTFSEQFNLGSLASGVYLLKLQHGNKTYYSKILIER